MKFVYSLLLLLFISLSAYADHVLGGDLTYAHISGNTYRVILTVYGECSGGSFQHLTHAEPRINVLNEKGGYFTIILAEEVNKREEVTNVCPSEAGNTTCKNPSGTIPGSTRFVYSTLTELPPAENWRLSFLGEMDNTGKMQSGFTFQISNVRNNSGYGFYLLLEAMLNNSKSANSSPEYTVPPTPFYCVGKAQQYSPGAIDANHDELLFSLVAPYDVNGIHTEYTPPYSPVQPFSTKDPLVYNTANGQMAFTPGMAEVVLIVHKTEEYREGVLVGSTMRAMTVFIRANCNNDLPYGAIEPNSVKGAKPAGNSVNTCKEDEWVRFRVPVRDNNNENVTVTLSNVPNGATTIIHSNGTANAEIEFNWNIRDVQPRAYTFFANYNDGACPTPGNQNVAYTVNIAYPMSVFHQVLVPTNCKYRQRVQFNVDGGVYPRRVVVTDTDNRVVGRYEDRTGIIIDSFKVGKYKVLAYADNLPCSSEYHFEVKDDGIYPDPPLIHDLDVCYKGEIHRPQPMPVEHSIVQWFDMDGNRLPSEPQYNTDSVRKYQWLVNQRVKVCESVFDTVNVVVHPLPEIEILNAGGIACYGDGIYLEAQGGDRYQWQPEEKIIPDNKGYYTHVNGPEQYTVIGYSRYNCIGRDTLIFTGTEPCCKFFYPDAFTPNADGLNDGWHPVTYGNIDFYLLSIYNRWGQRVYVSSDPRQKWDGTYGGILCDIGAYYYKLKANCVIGRSEEANGSFLLIR